MYDIRSTVMWPNKNKNNNNKSKSRYLFQPTAVQLQGRINISAPYFLVDLVN